MGLYVASLYLRSRNLKQDMTILEEMDKTAPVEQKQVRKPVDSTEPKAVTKKVRN
jgi:hypothetical protein